MKICCLQSIERIRILSLSIRMKLSCLYIYLLYTQDELEKLKSQDDNIEIQSSNESKETIFSNTNLNKAQSIEKDIITVEKRDNDENRTERFSKQEELKGLYK